MRRGTQRDVPVTGRNSRRALHGALRAGSGEMVLHATERSRGADVAEFCAGLAAVRPGSPKLLVLDNAPAHHTRAVRAACEAGGIEIAWLPFRSPELNPIEDLWRLLKKTVAANRVYESVDHLVEKALAFLRSLGPEGVARAAGLNSAKYNWLLT
jgi:transposase